MNNVESDKVNNDTSKLLNNKEYVRKCLPKTQ